LPHHAPPVLVRFLESNLSDVGTSANSLLATTITANSRLCGTDWEVATGSRTRSCSDAKRRWLRMSGTGKPKRWRRYSRKLRVKMIDNIRSRFGESARRCSRETPQRGRRRFGSPHDPQHPSPYEDGTACLRGSARSTCYSSVFVHYSRSFAADGRICRLCTVLVLLYLEELHAHAMLQGGTIIQGISRSSAHLPRTMGRQCFLYGFTNVKEISTLQGYTKPLAVTNTA